MRDDAYRELWTSGSWQRHFWGESRAAGTQPHPEGFGRWSQRLQTGGRAGQDQDRLVYDHSWVEGINLGCDGFGLDVGQHGAVAGLAAWLIRWKWSASLL